MKTITLRLTNFAVHTLLVSLILAGCSSDNDDTSLPNDGPKLRSLTIHQVDDDATRATLSDGGNVLSPSWEINDKVRCVNLSQFQYNNGINDTTLVALKNNIKTDFSGEAICNEGDYLGIIYPAGETLQSPITDDVISYTITLSGQDGTLSGLAKNYHHVYGVARVNKTAPNTADAEMGKTKSLLAVCKFSFKDQNGNLMDINKLEISDGSMGENYGTYPQTAHVTIYGGTIVSKESAKAVADTSEIPLTIIPDPGRENKKFVYVALMPTNNGDVLSDKTLSFVVNDTCSKTVQAILKPGVFVKAELQLDRISQ